MTEENPALKQRIASACRIGQWLASPLPRFPVSYDWPEGIIPVGNAAAAMEPIGGEGMGIAMRSAELAAMAVDSFEKTGSRREIQRLPVQFQKMWGVRRFACRAAAMVMSSPWLSHLAVNLLEIDKSIASVILAATGKGADYFAPAG